MQAAQAHPVARPVELRKTPRPPNVCEVPPGVVGESIETVVSIPDSGPDEDLSDRPVGSGPSHSEIQWRLANLGSQMGLEVWTPKQDRGKTFGENRIGEIPSMLDEVPPLFNVNAPLRRTIENIDCLWLKEASIVAAFEVEHTTSIYSGLLRMSDLVSISPLININLYVVAPDDRRTRFVREIARPTFTLREVPLHTVCRFLPYSLLCARIEQAKDLAKFLQPKFLDDIAESYDPAEELDD